MYKFSLLACFLLALPAQVFSQGCTGSITSTGGRKIGIVIDSSGSMSTTDPNNLRITAGEALAASLLPTDRVTVIDFDDSVRIVYPLGPPAGVSFAGIDSDGGTYIAGGVQAAIDEITKDPTDATAHVSGIVVLTDGEDSSIDDLVAQLNRAQSLGIRVSFGFLSPFAQADVQDPAVLAAILTTNGIYSTIDSAEAQANFVNLVLSHGLADVDASGSSNTLLLPGLITAGNVSASSSPATFIYDSQAGEELNFTITAITDEEFDVTLRDKTANKDLQTASTNDTGIASLILTVTTATELELDVSTTNSTSGLFSVSLVSSVNRTISVCQSSNGTSVSNTTGTSNTTVGPSTTLIPSASYTRSTTSPTMPVFTGAAATVQSFALAALFPVLMVMFM